MLHLAEKLKLPVDVVTQTVGILAKRRAGKSYTARRFAEQLIHARQQVVIADPKGDWWGIRSSADGRSPGLPVVILGGERGDVPLETAAGEVVAKLVVEERVSVLLDLSLLRKHEVATFMTAFLENLYRLKAREIYRTPVMLIVDEADAIAPQSPMKGEERMLGAAEDIVRRGGQRGIGCTLITQRSAVLNKNVLTQIQMLVALRTIAPQDLKAINAWVDVHGTDAERQTLMDSLPSLPTGDAWFWSPGWPTTDGIFERAHVLAIETFDSGATPKPGEKRREPKTIADVDLESLKRQMSETIERAKADDPKLLRKRISDLSAQVDKLAKELQTAAKKPGKTKETRVEVPIIPPKALERIESAGDAIREALTARQATIEKALEALIAIRAEVRSSMIKHESGSAPVKEDYRSLQAAKYVHPPPATPRASAPPRENHSANGDSKLSKAEAAILRAFYWLRNEQADKAKIAFYSGYSGDSSTFGNALGRLRTLGYVQGWKIAGSGEGLMDGVAGDKPTGGELREWLKPKLGLAENKILDALIESYPRRLSPEEIGAAAGYSPGSSTFGNAVGKLRTIEAAEGYARDGGTKAADVFFEE